MIRLVVRHSLEDRPGSLQRSLCDLRVTEYSRRPANTPFTWYRRFINRVSDAFRWHQVDSFFRSGAVALSPGAEKGQESNATCCLGAFVRD